MAGHSGPKDGVLSHAYVPAIHVFLAESQVKTWMPATSAGMTVETEQPLERHGRACSGHDVGVH
jgi:hypothetical protein